MFLQSIMIYFSSMPLGKS